MRESAIIVTRTDLPARPTIINASDMTEADDDFTHLATAIPLDWIKLSGLPANMLERRVRGIRLSRYRAAWQAAHAVQPGRIVVSHLPLMSAAVGKAMALLGKRGPHLAFTFNFTDRPQGARLAYMRRALADVNQFAVFSRHEKALYAEHFGFDPARFEPLIWTQALPPVQAEPGLPRSDQPYLCAIGGEGRDFRLLMDVARRLGPAVRMVVIARPHSLQGLAVPDHVEVLTNIPLARVWRIAQDSAGVLVPLENAQKCCGHITLVSAKLLGIPLATTFAYATREYVEGRAAVLECDPGDAGAFTVLATRLLDEAPALRAVATGNMAQERAVHDRQHWATYLDAFVRRHGAPA
jgi:hypothetical protein